MSPRRSLRHLLAALLAATITTPAMALTPDESAWVETIQSFRAETSETGIASTIMVVRDARDGDSPVASSWLAGRCVFVVSSSAYSTKLQGYASDPAIARLAAVAHEFGHCLHVAALIRGETGLPAVRTAEAEAWADAFAVLWIYCTHPDKYRDALAFFRKLRSHSPSGLYSMSGSAIDQAAEKAERGHSCSKQTVGAV